MTLDPILSEFIILEILKGVEQSGIKVTKGVDAENSLLPLQLL